MFSITVLFKELSEMMPMKALGIILDMVKHSLLYFLPGGRNYVYIDPCVTTTISHVPDTCFIKEWQINLKTFYLLTNINPVWGLIKIIYSCVIYKYTYTYICTYLYMIQIILYFIEFLMPRWLYILEILTWNIHMAQL